MPKNLYVVIHGHFYQPPREDPWIMEIEPQPSAYPYHDWNERINKECYEANTSSRLLDSQGHISSIINNYEYINFNFGPTLFRWIEKHDPQTYRMIIEADKKSQDRCGGHGNAIAQVFNHTILPLCNDHDKKTQILWGLREFEHHFGRKSEGIWLSETAVNTLCLELLIELGIKYIILDVSQAQAVYNTNRSEWINVADGSIDTTVPYAYKSSKGEIAIFFYNKDISHAIAFEHLLRSADSYRNMILYTYKNWFQNRSARKDPNKENCIISVATDGESYGHHEPFGDMCLAALIQRNERDKEFTMTNYGHYLEINPPKHQVVIKDGNNGLGTSWSCAHGVGRWMEDCGCSTGAQPGWNQKWRSHFRFALDQVRDEIASRFEDFCSSLDIDDPWKLRNDYIYLDLDTSENSKDNFFNINDLGNLSPENKIGILKVLEAQRYTMYMYTSCAWFFAEVSGIETVQNMKYAFKALDYMKEHDVDDVLTDFKSNLHKAKSNILEFDNGKRIFEMWVEPGKMRFENIAHHVLILNLMGKKDQNNNAEKITSLWQYKIDYEEYDIKENDGYLIFHGILNITDSITLEKARIASILLQEDIFTVKSYMRRFSDPEFWNYIKKIIYQQIEEKNIPQLAKNLEDWFTRIYSVKDLCFEIRERILISLFRAIFNQFHRGEEIQLNDVIKLAETFQRMEVPLPVIEKSNLVAYLNNYLYNESEKIAANTIQFDYKILTKVLKISKKMELALCQDVILEIMDILLEAKIDNAIASDEIPDVSITNGIIRILNFINEVQLPITRKNIENKIFSFLNKTLFNYIVTWKESNKEDQILLEKINNFLNMSEKLNIRVSQFYDLLKK